jgi:membrane-associated phospholipid phosphatase
VSSSIASRESQDSTIAEPAPLALARRRRRPRPRPRPRLWVQLLVVVWLCWIYDAIANLAHLRERSALAHGVDILHFEQWLHLDPERGLDTWLHGHPLIGVLTGDYYDNAHFIVTLSVLAWLWWRHPVEYRPLRNTLVLVNVIGFVVFWLYPVAPPRLLPGQHIYDIVALTHAIGGWHTGTLSKAANQFAAMPSLHIGWAMWAALGLWMIFRKHGWALLVWVYPIVTAFSVLATGNHYLSDCVAGAATAAVSVLVAFPLRAPFRDAWDRRRRAQADVADLASVSAPTGVVNTPKAGKAAHSTNAHP